MTTWIKVTLSIIGVFLFGVTATYQASPTDAEITMKLVVSWIMGGLAPVASYLIGYFQLNPAIRRPLPPGEATFVIEREESGR